MIEKVEERVKEVLEEISPLPPSQGRVDNDLPLSKLEMDSLDVTEFVISLEDEFMDEGLTVDDNVVHDWVTLGDVIKYVTENVSQ